MSDPISARKPATQLPNWGVGLAAIFVLAGFQAGCAGSTQGANSPDGTTRRNTAIEHEACDIKGSGAERMDADGDGKPEVTVVKEGEGSCWGVDLNFDGRVDSWVYFDSRGQIRRREFAFGRDDRINEIRLYQNGVLVEQQRATTLGGKLDTWHFYQGGQLARTERDSDGDEVIDQWWEYPSKDKPSCPRIHSDVDGDGKPDPGATVDICKETGYVPPERPGENKTTSPDFNQPGALPTEVDNKPEGESKEEPAEKPAEKGKP